MLTFYIIFASSLLGFTTASVIVMAVVIIKVLEQIKEINSKTVDPMRPELRETQQPGQAFQPGWPTRPRPGTIEHAVGQTDAVAVDENEEVEYRTAEANAIAGAA